MEQLDNSKHKCTKVEVEVKPRITIGEIIRITGQIADTEDNTDRIEVGLDTNKLIGEVTLEETGRAMVDKTVEENTGTITEMTVMMDRITEIIETVLGMTVMTEAETGPERGHFPEIMAIMLE